MQTCCGPFTSNGVCPLCENETQHHIVIKSHPIMAASAALQLEVCRACFALNNMGVSLLEKGYFREATKTFREAVSSLQSLISCRLGNHPGNTDDKALLVMKSIQSKLHKACRRVAKRCHKTCQTTISVEISIIDDNDLETFQCAQLYGPSSSIAFPIRLQSSLTTETCVQDGLDWQISAVLYNFGIAHLLTYRSSRDKQLLIQAARLFRFTVTVLTRADQRRSDASARLGTLYLESLVLSSLSTVFRYQAKLDHVQDIQHVLLALQEEALALAHKNPLVHSSVRWQTVAPAA